MKIVNKYELAKQPYGTPFYYLEAVDDAEQLFQIKDGLQILTSNSKLFFIDGTQYFNGVCPLLPDYCEDGLGGLFPIDKISHIKFELYEDDTDNNCFDDCDKFLILSKEEFRIFIDTLENFYKGLEI